MEIQPDAILEAFPPYRPAAYTSSLAIQNLEAKVADPVFLSDIEPLVAAWPSGYRVSDAADLVRNELLLRL